MIETNAPKYVKQFDISSYAGTLTQTRTDLISVEEPLEIRLGWEGSPDSSELAVTMRTPEFDRELAAGFLFTEGIIHSRDEIANIQVDHIINRVTVVLRAGVAVDPKVLARHSFVASSCGVCGKKSIDAVRVKRQYETTPEQGTIRVQTIHQLPVRLEQHQSTFKYTGGLHASSLFDLDGQLLAIKEDVGRHNALDKLLGEQFLKDQLPLSNAIIMVSGRASFELVQKAAHAGLPILAAVGAPSSLAVELAEESNMTLLGFVRNERFNVYTGAHRII